MAVDHPPRPSSLKGQLARVRYQAAAVRLAHKHRQPAAMVGLTDVMQYVGLVGTLVLLDRPWMWPFLAAWALGVYVRAASFLMMRAYTPSEALYALVIRLVTPWYKLVIYARASSRAGYGRRPTPTWGPCPRGRVSRRFRPVPLRGARGLYHSPPLVTWLHRHQHPRPDEPHHISPVEIRAGEPGQHG